jgi:hypothetical protein
LVKNKHYFDRYVKMINHYARLDIKKSKQTKGQYEMHHILPKKIWPEYEKETRNLVVLPNRVHKIVHYFLFKSIRHSSCVYAINQMCRVDKGTHKFSTRLYDQVRREFARLISENNTGYVHSEEFKNDISKRFTGTNIYKNIKTSELKRFKVGKQPIDWIPFQTGRERSSESRAKLGANIRSRIWQYNELSKEVKFDKIIQPGFTAGVPPWFDNHAVALKDYKWLYNPITGEVKRESISNGIPEGYILGRQYDNKGFQKINEGNLVRMLDVKEKKFVLVDKFILPNSRYTPGGASIDNTYVIQYKNNTFYSWATVENAHPELPKYSGKRNMSIMEFIVPRKHHNQTKERQIFSSQYNGKTFRDIGILVIPLREFNFKENE